MVSSLLFTQPVNIEVSQSGGFILATGEELDTNSVPAVRYRFHDFKLEELEFIKKCLTLFPKSLHIAELRYDGNYEQEIQILNSLEYVAIFLRISLTDTDVSLERLAPEKMAKLTLLNRTSETIRRPLINFVDKLVLVDNSNTLYMLSAHRIRTFVANEFKIKERRVTFCDSPMTQIEADSACLSASLARELGAEYGQTEDMVIATNALEGHNCSPTCACNCIKHIIVFEDIKAQSGKPTVKVKKDLSDIPSTKAPSNFMNLPDNYEVDGQMAIDGSSGEIFLPKKEKAKKKLKLPKGVLKRY